MKPLRVAYLVVLTLSLALTVIFYWRYHIKNKEVSQYRHLSQLSEEAFAKVDARLAQAKQELKHSLQEIKQLNTNISALEKDNLSFKSRLKELKEEKETLQGKVARLIEEKTILEKSFLTVKGLKEALKIAKKERWQRRKLERVQNRLTEITMLKKLDEIALQQGNQGYLVRQGVSTFKPKGKVRVKLEPTEQLFYKK